MCACRRSTTRFYTVGIGHEPDSEKLSKISQAGNGKVRFFSQLNETVTFEAKSLIDETLSPQLDTISLKFDTTKIGAVYPHPFSVSKITKNQPYITYLFFNDLTTLSTVSLTYYNRYTDEKAEYSFQIGSSMAVQN